MPDCGMSHVTEDASFLLPLGLPPKARTVNDEHGESFHQDFSTTRERCAGKSSQNMLADGFWNLTERFVSCIIRRNRNDQHYAQICTTALFCMLVPTSFGSSLPSAGSFWIRLSYMKIQIDMVVYRIMLVKWPVCRNIEVQSVVLPS
jgi:hypothetical protein